MERSGNFYKAIQLGYILISILIGCMAYNSLYEWQEIEALELDNKKIDELRKEINNIQQFSDNIIFIVQGKLLQFRQYKLRWQTDSANLLTLP